MDGARRRDRRPAWLWLKRWVLCAREIEAWQTSEPAHIAEPVMAPFGDAMVAWQRSVEVSTRGRSMTFGPCEAAALASAAAGSWLTIFDSGSRVWEHKPLRIVYGTCRPRHRRCPQEHRLRW